MSIDDLKGLLDGMDPAALLPEVDGVVSLVVTLMRLAVLIGPILLLVLGLLYFFVPPKEANYDFGYRCYYGMGSVDAWRFTQRLAGMVWSGLGLLLLIVMLVISAGFGKKEMMEMLDSALKCVAWEVLLTILSRSVISTIVSSRFDRNGEKRVTQ